MAERGLFRAVALRLYGPSAHALAARFKALGCFSVSVDDDALAAARSLGAPLVSLPHDERLVAVDWLAALLSHGAPGSGSFLTSVDQASESAPLVRPLSPDLRRRARVRTRGWRGIKFSPIGLSRGLLEFSPHAIP